MFSVDHGAPGTVLSYNKEEYSGNINCIMHYDINEWPELADYYPLVEKTFFHGIKSGVAKIVFAGKNSFAT